MGSEVQAPPIAKPDATNLVHAGELLRAGALVAFPTETVYGLGANATDGRAVARIFEAKGRPRLNPLIVHVTDTATIEQLAVLTPAARRLAAAFWPGPLTLVLAKRSGSSITDLVTAGLETIAIRVPAHPIAQALLHAAGIPIAAPSANRSGHVSPTTAGHVAADLGSKVALILDGGATPIGLESTIVDATSETPRLLRLGGLARAGIEGVLGTPLADPVHDPQGQPMAPGMLASHYAPRAFLRLDAFATTPGEALLAFGPPLSKHQGPIANLSSAGDLREAAANLFSALRTLDAQGVHTIAVMAIPDHGLGEAINDRLRRAAAPRQP